MTADAAENEDDVEGEEEEQPGQSAAVEVELPKNEHAKRKRDAEKTLGALVGKKYKLKDGSQWTVVKSSESDAFGLKFLGEDGNLHLEECAREVFVDHQFVEDGETDFLEALLYLWPGDMQAQLTKLDKQAELHCRSWEKVSVREWLCFIGMLILARQYTQRGTDLFAKVSKFSCRDPPNFGQYMPEGRFNALRRYAPWAFADAGKLATDKWSMLSPVVKAYNDNRRRTIRRTGVIVLDESMSAWKPRATKTGGLPNITFIRRKPKPLGTEFKTACDGLFRILLHLEIQEGREAMRSKPKFKELGATTACTMRMTEACLGLGMTS